MGQSTILIVRLVNLQTYKEYLSMDVEYYKYIFPKVANVANKLAKLKKVVRKSQLPQRLTNPPPAVIPIVENQPVIKQERPFTIVIE